VLLTDLPTPPTKPATAESIPGICPC